MFRFRLSALFDAAGAAAAAAAAAADADAVDAAAAESLCSSRSFQVDLGLGNQNPVGSKIQCRFL